jgi:hypothetical protein
MTMLNCNWEFILILLEDRGTEKNLDILLYENWNYAPYIQEGEIDVRRVERSEKSLLRDFLERRAEGAVLASN